MLRQILLKIKIMKKTIILLTSLLLFIPLLASASFDKNLYYGIQQDSQVKELQEFLISKGYLEGSATGNFFSLTLKAVKNFQTDNNLPPTGYFGPLSRTTANNILSTDLAASNTESAPDNNPTPTPPATTNDIVSSLQAQIALLQKQLDAMNAQSQTNQQATQQLQQIVQQVQQNTQQIAQNTTPQVAAVSPPPPTYPDLQVSCSGVATIKSTIGTVDSYGNPLTYVYWDQINWTASPSGGDGNYKYYWAGSNALTSSDPSFNLPCSDNPIYNSDGSVSLPDDCFNIMTNNIPGNGSNKQSITTTISDLKPYADSNGVASNLMRVFVKSNNQVKYAKCSVTVPTQ